MGRKRVMVMGGKKGEGYEWEKEASYGWEKGEGYEWKKWEGLKVGKG